MFLDFEKNVKNVKKRTYSFTGHLITQPLITQYRKSVPVSHQHQTSCSLLRSADTRKYAMFSNGSEWITLRELGIELK